MLTQIPVTNTVNLAFTRYETHQQPTNDNFYHLFFIMDIYDKLFLDTLWESFHFMLFYVV